jgi:hypothetical protein
MLHSSTEDTATVRHSPQKGDEARSARMQRGRQGLVLFAAPYCFGPPFG